MFLVGSFKENVVSTYVCGANPGTNMGLQILPVVITFITKFGDFTRTTEFEIEGNKT